MFTAGAPGFLRPKGTNQNLLPYMDLRNHKRDARKCRRKWRENLEADVNNRVLQQGTVF